MTRAYAARYPAEIKFITAHERYEQEVRSRAGSFGATAGRITARRSTEASVTFAHVTDSLWIMTREVLSVDGRTLPGTPPPRINEPQSEGEVLRALRAAADDGARWNIGNVQRNINTPTLVLWFLEEPIAQRFQFQVSGTERTAAGTCRIIRYHELARPPLMAVNGSRVPTSGKIWVLPDSGAIVRTQLVLEHTIPSNRGPIVASRATITVDYMPYADADLWVPAMMTERYEEPGSRESETVLATAKYSDYKRFRVSSKVK
jgi:hypothetical protein